VGGHRAARLAGVGQEFLDHRSFHPGDDLRSVNWRAYLRFERFYLKTFHLEPRVPMRLLLDVSASMTAGARPAEASKFDYARQLTAALAYIGLVRLESMEIIPFATRLARPMVVSGGRHRFHGIEIFLQSLQAEGKTGMNEVVRSFVQTYPQRGLVLVISDFLDEAGESLRALQFLPEFGHEIALAQIWSPEDRNPLLPGDWELIDSESGQTRRVMLDDSAQQEYARAFDAHSQALRRLALKHGGRYLGVSTETPLTEAVFGPMTQYM
jgi:uncharacterized protein (DUF58 family)